MSACDDVRMSLGVYALGALDAEETALVESHLATCPDCRAELAELTGLTALLGRVSEEDIAQAASPPEAVLDRLIAASARRHKINRLVFGLAASLVAAVLGGMAWLALGPSRGHGTETALAPAVTDARGGSEAAPQARAKAKAMDDGAQTFSARSPMIGDAPATPAPVASQVPRVELTGAGPGGRVRARLILTPRGEAGTSVDVALSGVPDGTSCRVTAIGTDGTRSPAGSWTVDHAEYGKGPARFQANTELTLDRIGGFEVRTAKGERIVWIPYEH